MPDQPQIPEGVERYRFQGGCGEHEENGMTLLNARRCADGEWVRYDDYKEQRRHADAAFKEAERYRQLHLIDAKRADQAEAKLARARQAATRIRAAAESDRDLQNFPALAGLRSFLLQDACAILNDSDSTEVDNG